jgi:hypothetical protein
MAIKRTCSQREMGKGGREASGIGMDEAEIAEKDPEIMSWKIPSNSGDARGKMAGLSKRILNKGVSVLKWPVPLSSVLER